MWPMGAIRVLSGVRAVSMTDHARQITARRGQAARTAQRPSAKLRVRFRFEETRGKGRGRTEGRRGSARMGWTAGGETGEAAWRQSREPQPPSHVAQGQHRRGAQGVGVAHGELPGQLR